jgi:hypothetical protein
MVGVIRPGAHVADGLPPRFNPIDRFLDRAVSFFDDAVVHVANDYLTRFEKLAGKIDRCIVQFLRVQLSMIVVHQPRVRIFRNCDEMPEFDIVIVASCSSDRKQSWMGNEKSCIANRPTRNVLPKQARGATSRSLAIKRSLAAESHRVRTPASCQATRRQQPDRSRSVLRQANANGLRYDRSPHLQSSSSF